MREFKKKELEKGKKSKRFRGLRIFGKIILGLFLFILLILLFIRSPWGQDIIISKIISSIEEKTGASIEVEKAFVSFSGDISIKGLYIEDLNGDTLIYSGYLEADVPLLPLIRGTKFSIDEVQGRNVTANIVREDSITGFNYQFLLDAYATADTTAVKPVATDTTAMKISLGSFHLENFDVDYKDEVAGTFANLRLEEFQLKMEAFDAEEMLFHIGKTQLTNARINYSQTKPFPPNQDSTAAPMPEITVDQLTINNVLANYRSVPDGIAARADLGKFLFDMPMADLTEKIVHINDLQLENSEIFLKMKSSPEEKIPVPSATGKVDVFEWPAWDVSVDKVLLANNDITYLSNGQKPTEGNFNPEAFVINDLKFDAADAYLKDHSVGIRLSEFQFTSPSGLILDRFEFEAGMNANQFEINQLVLEVNDNLLIGEILLEYSSVEDFIATPADTYVEARLSQVRIDVGDAFLFQPELQNNEVLRTLATQDIYGSIKISGTLASMQLPQVNVHWGETTTILASGSIENALEPEDIYFNFPQFKFVSQRNDIIKFIEEDSLGISVPEKIRLIGSFNGTPDHLSADANLILPEAEISLNGSFKNTEQIAFDADLEINNLNLGELLQNEQFGEISLKLTTKGEGANLNALDADLESRISYFDFNGYRFKDIEIIGEITDGTGPIKLDYRDYNLNMEMLATVELDTLFPSIELGLKVIGADLQGLGLTMRPIKTSFDLYAVFEGTAEKYSLASEFTEGLVVYDNESFLIGDLKAKAFVAPDTTAVEVESGIVDLQLQSNASPVAFGQALQQHFYSYISEETEIPDTIAKPVNLELRANISQAPIITEVLFPELKRLDTVAIAVDFNQAEKNLQASVSLPFINYNDYEVDSLMVGIQSDKDNFAGTLSFNAVNAGPVAMNRTNLSGNIADDRLHIDFESYARDSLLVNVRSTLNAENDSLYFHIDPSELLLNGEQWNIPQSNIMVFAEEYLGIDDFRLHRENKELMINSPGSDPEKEKMTISVNRFPLEGLLGFLNPDEKVAAGAVIGDFIIEEIYGKSGLLADLEIENFQLLEIPLGRLSLDAEALSRNEYTFNLALNDGDIDLDLVGDYIARDTVAEIDLRLDLNRLDLAAIEKFTDSAITNTSGFISGEFSLNGTTAEPVYNGIFEFNEAEFTVAALDAPFQISDEIIRVDTTGLYFEDFRIGDENSSGLVLNGRIITKSLTNPGFDLSIETENFNLLSSTAEDNDLVYGTAVVDATVSLEGDLNMPVIDAQINVLPETDLVYALPGSELKVVERDGVVRFVNRENPDNILTRSTEEEVATIEGMIINADIDISENSAFTLIIDKQSGDNLRVMGEGDLQFSISETGRTTLAGRYELSGGHYEMNLYGLVNRTFEIVPGSTISWFGDPMDANLDISAVYRVETSASSLMATRISGEDAGMRSRYRQVLPFLVYLNVDGRLMQPKLTFGIDMPEEAQGSLGGQVYARIQQLNQQENELNKQVFSLLVLSRFYPQSNTYGGEGGVLTLARDNLNQAISDQLNAFSGDLLEDTGIALNFGLNSYTDYRDAPTERTALEIAAVKKFYGGRLVVEVGSEVNIQGSDPSAVKSNPLIGNVSIQYLLTENGKFRLKGFRRNTFENIIDGQVIITGIALIFMQEFNEFSELWTKMTEVPIEETDPVKKDEKAQKKEEEQIKADEEKIE